MFDELKTYRMCSLTIIISLSRSLAFPISENIHNFCPFPTIEIHTYFSNIYHEQMKIYWKNVTRTGYSHLNLDIIYLVCKHASTRLVLKDE